MLDLEKCLIFPVPNRKVLNKVKCSIGISAKSCAALNHVATELYDRTYRLGSVAIKTKCVKLNYLIQLFKFKLIFRDFLVINMLSSRLDLLLKAI